MEEYIEIQEYIDMMYHWLEGIYGLITINAVTVLLIIFLGFVLSKIAEHTVRTFIKETPFEKDIKQYLQLKKYPSEIVGSVVGYFVDFGILIAVLYVLRLTEIVFYSFVVVALIVLIVYVLLNFKEIGPNSYAYVRLVRDYGMKEGKRMTFDGVSMKVKKIDAVQVTCVTKKDDVITIHNRTVLKELSKKNRPQKKKQDNA